jgi:Arc/MetJ-type ribon-helix-helix transcriptional regulator
MNVNIGTPYEAIIKKIIEKEYAGNQTEVIRQALIAYERQLDAEEKELVEKAITIELAELESKNSKTMSHEDMKKKFKWE